TAQRQEAQQDESHDGSGIGMSANQSCQPRHREDDSMRRQLYYASRDMKLPSPLYVILDQQAARQRDLGSLLEAILAGGCRLVQLRDKHTPLSELYAVARALSERRRQAGALFIVNDRADLALAVGAGGLHVGQDDLPAAVARRIIPAGMVLGVSTHDPEQARRALADGADYVAVGSIFPPRSQTGFPPRGPPP